MTKDHRITVYIAHPPASTVTTPGPLTRGHCRGSARKRAIAEEVTRCRERIEADRRRRAAGG